MATRHLFIDDREIDTIYNLTRVVNPPKKHEKNPLLRCEHPWEMLGIQTYGTVIYDESERLFKIWYLTHAGPSSERVKVDGVDRPANMTLLAYATSRDGIMWEKPELGQINFEGSKHNNLLRIGRLNVEGASILLEPRETDPSKRYKAFYWEHGSGDLTEMEDGSFLLGEGKRDGMWVSFSPDGIRWDNHPGNPVIDMNSDTGQSVVWDPRLNLYVAYGRFGAGGRKVARSESPDFVHWSKPQLVLEPDGEDGPNTQFYGISVTYYEGMYVGMLWIFHIDPEGHIGGGKDVGTIDIQLVSSRNGLKWERVGGRQVFVPNGPKGAWDSRIIQAACRFIALEDRILIYYNGTSCRHGQGRSRDNSEIGLATIRRDGFVSLDAGDVEGKMLGRIVEKQPGDIHLNLDSSQGEVTVEICDSCGKSLSGPSSPMTVDSLDHVVTWSCDFPQNLDGREIRVLIHGKNAKLFSYWFE